MNQPQVDAVMESARATPVANFAEGVQRKLCTDSILCENSAFTGLILSATVSKITIGKTVWSKLLMIVYTDFCSKVDVFPNNTSQP